MEHEARADEIAFTLLQVVPGDFEYIVVVMLQIPADAAENNSQPTAGSVELDVQASVAGVLIAPDIIVQRMRRFGVAFLGLAFLRLLSFCFLLGLVTKR